MPYGYQAPLVFVFGGYYPMAHAHGREMAGLAFLVLLFLYSESSRPSQWWSSPSWNEWMVSASGSSLYGGLLGRPSSPGPAYILAC